MIYRDKIADATPILAGATAVTKSVDISQFGKFSVLVIPDAAHIFSVALDLAVDLCNGAGKVQDVVLPIPLESHGNFLSPVIESRADIMALEITNGSAAPHTYDVYVYRM